MTLDSIWPRAASRPEVRAFDRERTLATMNAATTAVDVVTRNYDPETKTTTVGSATFYTPKLEWSSLVGEPALGRDEAWCFYTVLWKREAATILEATSEPIPDDLVGRLRHDLRERATPEWFDARAYWCCVPGLLPPDELARFVGDGAIFVHAREGGSSIITGHTAQVGFVEAFYQVVAPYLGERVWASIASALGPGDARVPSGSSALVAARLRLMAATGHFDDALLALLDTVAAQAGVVFDMLHAMRDPRHLATHAPRLRLLLVQPLMLEKWLDRFGASEPAWIVESLDAIATKREAEPLVAVLDAALPADALAPILRAVSDESKAKPLADKWLAKQAKATASKAKGATKPQKRRKGQ